MNCDMKVKEMQKSIIFREDCNIEKEVTNTVINPQYSSILATASVEYGIF